MFILRVELVSGVFVRWFFLFTGSFAGFTMLRTTVKGKVEVVLWVFSSVEEHDAHRTVFLLGYRPHRTYAIASAGL